jgi:hypothetical protein
MRLILLAALAIQLLLSLPAQAVNFKFNPFQDFVKSCSNPCVIEEDNGGFIDDYDAAAKLVNRSNMLFKIKICRSACTLFADKARTHVCILKHAKFDFHLASIDGELDKNNPFPGNSGDIVDWVNRHGGYPEPGEEMLHMKYKDALTFWKPCR